MKYGNLNKFSAFEFESYLNQLKQMIRKPDKILQQLNNRLEEQKHSKKKYPKVSCKTSLGAEYFGGILPEGCSGPQHMAINYDNFMLTIKHPNNCCVLSDGKIVIIRNICHKDSEAVIVGKSFLKKDDLYVIPCPSSLLGIYKVDRLSELECWSINLVKNKCINFEHEGENIIFPLLHTQKVHTL